MKKILIVALMAFAGIANAGSAENAMQQAIVGVGLSCSKVTEIFHNGRTMYSVACSGGQTYMVMVIPETSSAKVMTCREMALMGTKCFVKF